MLVRVLPNQLKDHWELIDKAIVSAFPDTAMVMKTALVRDLMLENAVCWFYMEQDIILAVFISRINNDYAVGRKTLTIVAAYGLEKLTPKVFIDSFKTAQAYGKGEGCKFLDFYTDNPRILEYANMFEAAWKSTYLQLKL